MKEKKQTWFERLTALFDLETVHHRTCRLCHRRILKGHKYHHVKVGPFWVDKVEHKNCANPTLETPYQIAQRLTPELPFDPPDLESGPLVDGNIFPTYSDSHREKIQRANSIGYARSG
jgi:hypothetical protein